MHTFPYTKTEFDQLVDDGQIKPDALFPIMDYAFCKHLWEHSPLIQDMCEHMKEYVEERLDTLRPGDKKP